MAQLVVLEVCPFRRSAFAVGLVPAGGLPRPVFALGVQGRTVLLGVTWDRVAVLVPHSLGA